MLMSHVIIIRIVICYNVVKYQHEHEYFVRSLIFIMRHCSTLQARHSCVNHLMKRGPSVTEAYISTELRMKLVERLMSTPQAGDGGA